MIADEMKNGMIGDYLIDMGMRSPKKSASFIDRYLNKALHSFHLHAKIFKLFSNIFRSRPTQNAVSKDVLVRVRPEAPF